MSTDKTLVLALENLDDTLQKAASIGKTLKGGEVIELVSDVGGGKTTFVRGLAKGMGSTDDVASPSFTISREYKCERGLELHHYDFYRLNDPGIVKAEIAESIADEQTVVAIEWSDSVKDVLPEDHIVITIKSTGDTTRELTIDPGSATYVLEKL